MHGATQQAIGPIAEQIANVDQNRRAGVRFCAGRAHGHGRPCVVAHVELKAGLPSQTEEKRDTSIIGVRAGADIGFVWLQRVGVERGQWWVVQEAQNVARGSMLAQVALVEETGRLYSESDAEEVIDFKGEGIAVIVWG